MATKIRAWLLAEGMVFLLASLVHGGFIVSGYEHSQARTAEGVIGIALLAGLALTFIYPRALRKISLAVQAFALLGTLVGATMIAIGVGPQTLPDRIFHGLLLILLATGLMLSWRRPTISWRAPAPRGG